MDSSTAKIWAWKTNFSELQEDLIHATVQLKVARGHSARMIENRVKDYSQWFPGRDNMLADSFSCEEDSSNTALTALLTSLNLPQITKNFQIAPLSIKISSWLTSRLQ